MVKAPAGKNIDKKFDEYIIRQYFMTSKFQAIR